ncbi:hypothetical protein [Bradyrhizobium sp. CCBAU 53421]|uniref:hypothetical protein n=1 Tax=Bradyrhizobium sp. CCBAU 53421 TaxID=1325120 RepID=UPI00188A7720|nr:hypothetical protein [Bradyrhizobium sp. CCBAU 53421]
MTSRKHAMRRRSLAMDRIPDELNVQPATRPAPARYINAVTNDVLERSSHTAIGKQVSHNGTIEIDQNVHVVACRSSLRATEPKISP